MSGIQLVRALRAAHPDIQCLMLSGHVARSYVTSSLAAGARGYVAKDNAVELVNAVRSVLAGNVYISAALRENPSHL
jgi:DNA-binding NarL/FixJ family response regulator